MLYRMRCNLKTAPNIGEVSFVSAFGPLFEWNVPVFPMASRRSRATQTSGPYALCHPFPPTSDAPDGASKDSLYICEIRGSSNLSKYCLQIGSSKSVSALYRFV